MTPAIHLVKQEKVIHTIHQYQHEQGDVAYGEEAANKLGLRPEQVFKTLVIDTGSELVVGIIPVLEKLSMKLIAKACGAKKAVMASPADVERSTGYVLGGVSPLGQKKRLKTVIDSSANEFNTIYVSAGRRGLEIELNGADLAKLLNAKFTLICQ